MNVIFDLDDTLYPEIDYVRSGYQAVGAWIIDQMGLDGFGDACWREFQHGDRTRVFNTALARMNVCESPELINDLIEIYRSHTPEIRLFDDAAAVLARLTGKLQLGLLSDGFAIAQRSKIRSLKIEHYFKSIVITDELGDEREFWKPSSVPYQVIMESMSGAANTFVYIADNDRKDFVSANRLGWTTVKVARIGSVHRDATVGVEYRAQFEITSLSELDSILDQVRM